MTSTHLTIFAFLALSPLTAVAGAFTCDNGAVRVALDVQTKQAWMVNLGGAGSEDYDTLSVSSFEVKDGAFDVEATRNQDMGEGILIQSEFHFTGRSGDLILLTLVSTKLNGQPSESGNTPKGIRLDHCTEENPPGDRLLTCHGTKPAQGQSALNDDALVRDDDVTVSLEQSGTIRYVRVSDKTDDSYTLEVPPEKDEKSDTVSFLGVSSKNDGGSAQLFVNGNYKQSWQGFYGNFSTSVGGPFTPPITLICDAGAILKP